MLRLFLDFLFPKSQKVLELEALSSGALLSTLPSAILNSEDDNTIALFDYSHTLVKEIIWQVKYTGNRRLSDKLGEILYDVIIDELGDKNILGKWKTVILMPMPVSDKRRYERGWNQAELLTDAVKRRDQTGVFQYPPRQLAKIHHTESQTRTTSKAERKNNLAHSMKVLNPLSVRGQFVVLIDDVLTTGSTFAEARRALYLVGAKKILCIAVAH